jgi:ATP-dependent RNA helicase DDX3X
LSGGTGRVNELGFHGDMRPNQILENRLFPPQKKGTVEDGGINFDKYDDIPVEVSGDDAPEGVTAFIPELLGQSLYDNIIRARYTKPTPVQKYSIPIGLSGRDLMACAQTGSGKTAGFLFPTLATMLRSGAPTVDEHMAGRNRRHRAYPTCLILAPTRELASQIHDEACKFCYCTGVAPVVIYGGADVRQQQRELERGCDLLTATPGRLVDLIERGRISLMKVRHLILDEADRMLDMGFEPQIRRIVQQEDMTVDRQTFMFSATFPREIQRLASDFLAKYVFLSVGRVGAASTDVEQRIEYVEERDKEQFLIKFLNTIDEGLVLVFTETKRGADSLEYILCKDGFPTTSIHGDRSQREREEALQSFRTGRTPILVATDVAARGLDIKGVTHVINYDMPNNIDDYVHRIGRTGRIGRKGKALSFFNQKNRNVARDLYDLLTEAKMDCPGWLDEIMARGGGYGRGGRGKGGRAGSSKRMAKDYRKEGGGDRGGRGGDRGGGRNYNRGGGGNDSW